MRSSTVNFRRGRIPAGPPLGDLPPPVLEADREVVADGACEGMGKEGIEIGPLRQLSVRVLALGGLHGEALVPVRDVGLLEEAIALLQR